MQDSKNRIQQENTRDDIEDICNSTWKGLYRYIYHRVQNREEAEDITQETYERAFASLRNKDYAIRNYGSYLRTIALNIIRDQWRLRQRRGVSVNIEEVEAEALAVVDFSDAVDDREVIQIALQRLTRDQQQVIQYRILQGYSCAETAKLLNKKEGTVRVLQFRAMKELTKILKELM